MSNLALSFFVGILSSAAFAALVVLSRRARFRLSFHAITVLLEQLGSKIQRDNFKFDYLVAIGRNSGVAGSVLAGQFGLTAIVSLSTVKTRLGNGARTIELDPMSEHIVPMLTGKRVLVFICCNDSGASLAYVVNRIEALGPDTEVRTAALYSVESPSFEPKYTAVVLGRDSRRSMTKVLTGLPWVTKRWVHPFGDERKV